MHAPDAMTTGHPFWDWIRQQPLKRREQLLGMFLEVQLLVQGVR